MTFEEFESELKRIAGVFLIRENDDPCSYLVVHVGGLKMDYFLRQNDDILDSYMCWHYITLIRMLAACM